MDLPENVNPDEFRPATSSFRGAIYLALASGVGIGANYAFLIVSGRLLENGYGELGAILALLAVVLLPTAALQMAVSREIARRVAVGATNEGLAFAHAVLRAALVATPFLMAICFVGAWLSAPALDIGRTALVLASLTVGAALAPPVALGILQGEHRFGVLGAAKESQFPLRLAVLIPIAAAGATLNRLVGVIVIGAAAFMIVSLWPVRHVRSASRATWSALRPFGRYLVPVLGGLFGIALLVNTDVVVVNATFGDVESSAYAAAAAFGRVGYFIPATILVILFPRAAARHAQGLPTDDILGRSLILTAGFCAALALFYAIVGEPLVRASFGGSFDSTAGLLPLFTLEMMLFSLANVLVGFHLAEGRTRFAWIVAASVPAQIVVLLTVPDTLRQVVMVNVAVGAALLVIHEVFIGSSRRAVVEGARRLREGLA